MGNFQVIDMIFFALIILMGIHGYLKGLVEEIFSLAAPVVAGITAVFLHPAGAEFVRKKAFQDVKYLPEIIAFAAIFIIVIILIKMLEHVLKDVVAGAKLGSFNKLLGLFFGLVEGLALTAIIFFLLTVQPLFDPAKIIGDSLFAKFLLPLIQIPLNKGKEIINAVQVILPGIRFPV